MRRALDDFDFLFFLGGVASTELLTGEGEAELGLGLFFVTGSGFEDTLLGRPAPLFSLLAVPDPLPESGLMAALSASASFSILMFSDKSGLSYFVLLKA